MANSLRLGPSDLYQLIGEVKLPASKSVANRALILQALSSSKIDLLDLGDADDVVVMKKALSEPNSSKNNDPIYVDVGMAGTALRFLTAAFSILPGKKIIDGHPRLRERPITALIEALKKLGAKIECLEKEASLPMLIEGTELKGSTINIAQELSSQFVSALMLIGPFLKDGLHIKRDGARRSESYVQLTQCIMQELGFKVEVENEDISISRQEIKEARFTIEADWSSAAYFLAFAVLVPKVNIKLAGLKKKSCQADQKMLEILRSFGLDYFWEKEDLHLRQIAHFKQVKFFRYDCSDIPDQAQTLAFLCAALGVEAELSGLDTLSFKETDRIEALAMELSNLGLEVNQTTNSIAFRGDIRVKKAYIKTYNDHRMAMSAALLATRLDLEIENPAVVSKSYPVFWDDLKRLTSGS